MRQARDQGTASAPWSPPPPSPAIHSIIQSWARLIEAHIYYECTKLLNTFHLLLSLVKLANKRLKSSTQTSLNLLSRFVKTGSIKKSRRKCQTIFRLDACTLGNLNAHLGGIGRILLHQFSHCADGSLQGTTWNSG